ncbi:lipopolysaccharide biosynthesis protein [Candidatus Gottesmanbacteria bacterium]|nr:lipopolysaccharide biosynthesis protein [Candidatus Gottesmanbacteria bacterium]
MGYFKDAIKGVSWMGGARVAMRAVGFLRIAILARLLLPVQFGVFGIAVLTISFLEIITETGINVFLIQEKADLEEYVNTAWLVSIIRGLLISLLIVLTAPLVVGFFNVPGAYGLFLLASFIPLLKGFINPSVVRFQKELQFNKEFFYRVSIYTIDSTIAIVFALWTHSAASLVLGLIGGAIFEVVLSFIIVEPRPKFAFEGEKIKRIINRGKWMTLAGIFNYFFQNGDNIVVGKILGTSSLGLYQAGYSLSTLPITEVADIFGKVTFPVYVKISDNTQRLKEAFLKVVFSVSGLVIPFGIILFFFTKEIVLLVLGQNWLEAVPAIKVLAIYGVIRAISGISSALFLALKKQEFVTGLTFVSVLGLAILVVPFTLRFGLVGAGLSVLFGSLAALPVIGYYLLKIFKE